jgi:hypothetical protein
MDITRNFGMDHWTLEMAGDNGEDTAAPAYTKHDKSRARFTLTLGPHLEKTFDYTVTKYMGARSDYYAQKMNQAIKEQER